MEPKKNEDCFRIVLESYVRLQVEEVLAAVSTAEEAHELHGSLDGQLLVHVVQLVPNLSMMSAFVCCSSRALACAMLMLSLNDQ